MKKISVITPSLNSEKYIKKAIESVLLQDYPNFEHIIIDGDSSDNTLSIIQKYSHLIYISEKDKGQSDAMNKGFNLSTGEIIVYLNADDYFEENIFKLVSKNFDAKTDIVFGNLKILYMDGSYNLKKPSILYTDIIEYWKKLFPLNPVQYFYKRELQEKYQFNTDNHYAMDHEFLLNICKNSKIKHLDKIFGTFNMIEGTKTYEVSKNLLKYLDYNNYEYVDKYLTSFDQEYIINYKKTQYNILFDTLSKKYQWLLKEAKWLMSDNYKKDNFRQNINTFIEIIKDKNLLIYGVGTNFKLIYELIKENKLILCDNNTTIINTVINGHTVNSISNINNKNFDTVVVTPFGYKKEISKVLSNLFKNKNILFLEDYIITSIPIEKKKLFE